MDRPSARRNGRASFRLLFVLVLVVLATPAAAQEGDGSDELVQQGSEVYTRTCAGCHQTGGVGIPGTFPQLVDNPNVQDTEYLVQTIRNGRQGPIQVLGVDYDGVMPAFSTLSDDEIDALVAYIQGGFVVPGGAAPEATGPVAGSELPDLSGMFIVAAFGLAAAVAALVFAPRIVSVTDRLGLPWLDAWLRAATIVVFFVVATVVIPSMILKTETVGRLPRAVQDIIGGGLWVGGLAVGLWGLWWAHRENRI